MNSRKNDKLKIKNKKNKERKEKKRKSMKKTRGKSK